MDFRSLESFKSIMPVIDVPYPEFYIINERNAGKISSAIDRIESPLKITEFDSVMEVIHGEQNDAIVIQQKGVRAEPNYINDVEISFKHRLLHALGHFYSLYTECPGANLYRNLIQEAWNREETVIEIGYRFWTDFISEVIACKIDIDITNRKEYDWYISRRVLNYLIQQAFDMKAHSVHESSLAYYFAKLLADKNVKYYLKAAEDGTARLPGSLCKGFNVTETFAEAGEDPTCKLEVGKKYQPCLQELQSILEEQLSSEHYWQISPEKVSYIGLIIKLLNDAKNSENTEKEAKRLLLIAKINLTPLNVQNREMFILAVQEAFNYGALEEFGLRDNHFEASGQIISRETIEKSIDDGEAFFITTALENKIIGGLVIKTNRNHGNLDLLFVSPHEHNKGFGYGAWCCVENLHPEVKVWETVTPYFEKRNIYFYVNKCGFHVVEFLKHDEEQNKTDMLRLEKNC